MLKKYLKKYFPSLQQRVNPRIVALLCLAYGTIRILSLVLWQQAPIILEIIGISLLLTFVYVYKEKPYFGWLFVLTELIIGGSGNFFEIQGIALRTILLILFCILWYGNQIRKNQWKLIFFDKKIMTALAVFGTYTVIACIRGYIDATPPPESALSDMISFCWLLFIPPSVYFIKNFTLKHVFETFLWVFTICSTVFSFITFAIFSSQNALIHGAYYTWFRDVVMGKVTYLGMHFYRIVSPEHMLLVFGLLYLFFIFLSREKTKLEKKYIVLYLLLIGLLAINLTRAYILALITGFIVLSLRAPLKKSVPIFGITLLSFITIFSAISFVSSRGQSLNLDIIGIRTVSVIRPTEELSALTRMQLLDPIFNKFQESPFLGHGLGSSFEVIIPDPDNQQERKQITTDQYDWGFFEILVELGVIGTVLYAALFIVAVFSHIPQILKYRESLYVLACTIAVLTQAITSPILEHVIGIAVISLCISYSYVLKENAKTFTEKIAEKLNTL